MMASGVMILMRKRFTKNHLLNNARFLGNVGTSFRTKKFIPTLQKENLDESSEHSYHSSFMELLKNQKEAPFLFSTKDTKYSTVDLSVLSPFKKKASKFLFNVKSFKAFGFNHTLVDRLSNHGITTPLPVQLESMPTLLEGHSAIIESATGSGKTLTYLLPIIQKMGKYSCSNIIIVPTRELASQVYMEAHKYIQDKSVISRHVSGVNVEHDKKLGHALKDSKILIGTPRMLLDIIMENPGYFRKVKCVVLDEADKLLPYVDKHSKHSKRRHTHKVKPTEKILSIITHYQRFVQLVATSATLSPYLVQELQDIGFNKNCKLVKLIPKDNKHGKIPDCIQHRFTIVDDEQEEDKYAKLKVISRLFQKSKEKCALVFIPGNQSVEAVVNEFKDINLNAVALYKQLLLPSPGSINNFLRDFEEGDIQIVVSTEETVRGIDIPFVKSAYLTYVPETPENYVHVAGRVGRLGKQGIATTLISKQDELTEKKKLKKRYSVLGVKGKLLQY